MQHPVNMIYIIDSDYTNEGLDLLPGSMREFEVMHRDNLKYHDVKVKIGDVRY